MTLQTLLLMVTLVGCARPRPPAPVAVATPTCPTPMQPDVLPEPPAPWAALPPEMKPIALAREIVVDTWAATDFDIPATSAPTVPGIIEAIASASPGGNDGYMLSFKGLWLEPWFAVESGDKLLVRSQIGLDRQRRRFPARPLAPGEANPWQLVRPFHIIRAEVNGGAGGAERSVVITNANVLDGTAVFPIDLPAFMAELAPRLVAAYAKDEQRIEKLRTNWVKTLPTTGTRTLISNNETRQFVWRDRKLVIVDQRVSTEEWKDKFIPRTPPCPKTHPCPIHLPRPRVYLVIRSAVRQELDAKTLVLVQTRYRATATISRLNVAPGVR